LFYCNARWLSKGKVILRVYELRKEIFIFLKENHALGTTFEDEVFLTQLTYLCDIFKSNKPFHSKEKIPYATP